MASLIEGYEYDIFISYRQKDNKGDGWVTEFVDALRTELESTFKEEVSVYFDVNPHDGLLETHDVDASLKEKLKCLVFIPIISRTYCDPKSFAWEHEFKAFIDQATHDQFGMKVKLPNVNVASRVLPIRIHDLDSKDLLLCESALGGYLRGIEFIYKEPGVNRPLTPYDDEKININKTRYRNQINRVANAVQEIISGLRGEKAKSQKIKLQPGISVEKPFLVEKFPEVTKPVSPLIQKIFSGIVLAAIIILAVIFLYSKIFRKDRKDIFRSKGEISIAIMPFQNLSNDTLWNVWQEGIQNELIHILSNTEELKVRQTETIRTLIQSHDPSGFASMTPTIARNISRKLDANIFIQGNINQVGSILRINSQLTDSETEEIIKTFQIIDTASEENIFRVIDSLSVLINNFLIITVLKKESALKSSLTSTNSPEAYRYLIYGENSFLNRDFFTAREFYLKALALDPNIHWAKIQIAFSYANQSNYQEGKKWALDLIQNREQMPFRLKVWADFTYSWFFETPNEEIKSLKQLLEFDDQSDLIYYQLGAAHLRLLQYDKAIPYFERVLQLLKNWDSKPSWSADYSSLGGAYQKIGLYRKEQKLYNEAEKYFPRDYRILNRQAILALSLRKTKIANELIEKWKSVATEQQFSESRILANIANIYWQAGILNEAEAYFRQALSLDSENPNRLYNLAWFLIENNLNVSEGLELIEISLQLSPDDYIYLHINGLGLYKQGKYQEALEVLQKSWDLRREQAVYNHEAFLHLEEARKAVANL